MSLLGGTYGSGEREFNFNAETLRELFFYISVQAMESVQHGSSPTVSVRTASTFKAASKIATAGRMLRSSGMPQTV
jgi:hypothetical protein